MNKAKRALVQKAVDKMLEKEDVGNLAGSFQNTYGAKVWEALNSRTVLYNSLNVSWKDCSGWKSLNK